MVYVINKDGYPLMPTERHGKVRRLLRDNQAVVIKRCPFTIKLLYQAGNAMQDIALGVDAGSKHIGLSATTEDKVLFESVVELRTDITKLLAERRELRQSRRNRKTRYREPRFNNRRREDGWLAPSIKQKIDTHITAVKKVCDVLPVTRIVVETASFDIQKIKNPSISGTNYQHGDQLGFWNVREYVLFRDGHQCQCCKGKSGDKTLNVHHIESRQTGGDAPNNLITLCEYCHKQFHLGNIQLPKSIKRGTSFRDAAFMGIMRWAFYDKLKSIYPSVSMTYGYITKNTRIAHGLPKEHYIDARCISGHPDAVANGIVYYQRKARCHNRQIHKVNAIRGGIRKRNQAAFIVKGFRLFDKVRYEGQECFICGRRTSGYFDIRHLDGTRLNASVSYRHLTLLEKSKHFLIERRVAIPPQPTEGGVSSLNS